MSSRYVTTVGKPATDIRPGDYLDLHGDRYADTDGDLDSVFADEYLEVLEVTMYLSHEPGNSTVKVYTNQSAQEYHFPADHVLQVRTDE